MVGGVESEVGFLPKRADSARVMATMARVNDHGVKDPAFRNGFGAKNGINEFAEVQS